MARQQRSTTFTQESTHPIARVALYARVSTLNNQDPEMQLAELREYAGRRGWQTRWRQRNRLRNSSEFNDHQRGTSCHSHRVRMVSVLIMKSSVLDRCPSFCCTDGAGRRRIGARWSPTAHTKR
jgi:hypothetical protein